HRVPNPDGVPARVDGAPPLKPARHRWSRALPPEYSALLRQAASSREPTGFRLLFLLPAGEAEEERARSEPQLLARRFPLGLAAQLLARRWPERWARLEYSW